MVDAHHYDAIIAQSGEVCDFYFEGKILIGIYKKEKVALEDALKATEEKRQFLQGRKVCTLIDFRKVKSVTKEARDYYSRECGKEIKAMAILINSPVGMVMGKFFTLINKPAFPFRIFNEWDSAMKWSENNLLSRKKKNK